MFVYDLPPKEQIIQQSSQDKPHYVIHTFLSNTAPMVQEAVNYYYQKYHNFIKLANAQITQTLVTAQTAVPSLNSMFNAAFNKYNSIGARQWQQLQRQDSTNIQAKARQFNQYTQNLTAHGQQTASFVAFLNQMNSTNLNMNQIPGTIDLSSIQSMLQSFSAASSTNLRSLGGHRSRLLGEIFEEGVNSMIVSETQGLLGYMQVGAKKSLLPGGNIAYGKTDGMLFVDATMDGGLVTNNKITTTAGRHIELEASELFDLSAGGALAALQKYANLYDYRGGMLGITNKAWIGPTGSFGSFAASANEIRMRRAQGISDYFEDKADFQDYNVYVVSKYLINIIGAYNGIVATGDEMMPTYVWLTQLYNSLRAIRHSYDLVSSRSSRSSGTNYQVHNKLIIANVKN